MKLPTIPPGLAGNGSVRSNRKSFEKTGPPFEVDHFSRSDRLEFWLNGSRPRLQDLEDFARSQAWEKITYFTWYGFGD